jgi:hypothetical protein
MDVDMDVDRDVDIDVDMDVDMDECFDIDKYEAENTTDNNKAVESINFSSLVSNATTPKVNPVLKPQTKHPDYTNCLDSTSLTSSLIEVGNVTALDPDCGKPPTIYKKGAARQVSQPFELWIQNEERDWRVRKVQQDERMKKWLDGINIGECRRGY